MTDFRFRRIWLAGPALVGVVLLCEAVSAQAPRPRDQADTVVPGWLSRSMRAEANRLAADAGTRADSPLAVERDQADVSAWENLQALEIGTVIRLERVGLEPSRYRLLSVEDAGITILDLSSPAIPGDLARELGSEAESHPRMFGDALGGDEFRWSGISVGPSGVSRDGRYLFPLSLVAIDVPRMDVIEVSEYRAHVRRGVWRGALIGAVGFALLGVTTCQSDCGAGWTGAIAAGSTVGMLWGAIIGGVHTPDLVYRR